MYEVEVKMLNEESKEENSDDSSDYSDSYMAFREYSRSDIIKEAHKLPCDVS